jgi:hypothetical protein
MTSPADRPELPPQSRISSRVDGSEISILIPRSTGASGGCVPGSLVVAFAFLAVTFTAQGLLTRNPLWSIGGLVFFLLTGWQILARFGPALKTPSQIKLQISPEALTVTTGSAEKPMSRRWTRSAISSIRAEPPMLNIYLTGRDTPVCLLSDLDPAELEWIADQIRAKWGHQKD